jgi:hypothetical protein
MSEPAKDKTDLVQRMAKAMHDSVYGGESAWMDVSKIEQSYREMEADAALAAIRAAGWVVVPVALMEEVVEELEEMNDSHYHHREKYPEEQRRYERDMEMPRAVRAMLALDPDGQKERRAKALSELAEMDADLLDIDPEGKP